MIEELKELLAYSTFMLSIMAITFFVLMFFAESILGIILLLLFRKIIKRI
jgi:hypothetical protein